MGKADIILILFFGLLVGLGIAFLFTQTNEQSERARNQSKPIFTMVYRSFIARWYNFVTAFGLGGIALVLFKSVDQWVAVLWMGLTIILHQVLIHMKR